MVRVFVVYESEPDPESYEEHVELCRQVPGATFRHGRVFGGPTGEREEALARDHHAVRTGHAAERRECGRVRTVEQRSEAGPLHPLKVPERTTARQVPGGLSVGARGPTSAHG